MAKFTYTIFDGEPNDDGDGWPGHERVEIEADGVDEATDDVRDILSVEAAGLNASDGYEPGDRIHAIVWDVDGGWCVGQPVYTITAEDLGEDEDEPDDDWRAS